MNTKTDEYINSLKPGDIVQYDGTLHAIVHMDQHECHINIDGETMPVEWGEISEEYELMQLEEIQDAEQEKVI